MKEKQMKVAAMLVATMALTTTTAWANPATDIQGLIATAPTASAAQQVSLGSVTDGRFTFTLEEVSATPNRVEFIYSIEGLTKEAQAELKGALFNSSVSMNMPEGARFNAGGGNELEERHTETKRYYSYTMDGFDNPTGQPVTIVLDMMSDVSKAITLPTDTNIEMVELILGEVNGSETVIRLSSQGLFVEKDVIEGYEDAIHYLDILFRMEDDSIKTLNQLFMNSSSSFARGGDGSGLPLRYKHSADPVGTVDVSKIKSVIEGNLEYDFRDTTQVREVQLEGNYKPVTVVPVQKDWSYMVPVRDAIEKLGGEVTYNAEDGCVVVQYRGDTLEVWSGKETYRKNGEMVELNIGRPPATTNDGRLIMDTYIFRELLNVNSSTVFINPDWSTAEDGAGHTLEVNAMYLIP